MLALWYIVDDDDDGDDEGDDDDDGDYDDGDDDYDDGDDDDSIYNIYCISIYIYTSISIICFFWVIFDWCGKPWLPSIYHLRIL